MHRPRTGPARPPRPEPSPRADVLHVVVGPDGHGVVRHGLEIARATGHAWVRAPRADAVTDLPTGAVVHVPFTDRLFGAEAETALDAFLELADRVAAHDSVLSVTLHDVPHDDSPLQKRRRRVYEQVAAAARGVVVNSGVELALLAGAADGAHSVRLIPLPVHAPVAAPPATTRAGVAVLGFVFPDRGYEDVLAALAALGTDETLLAVGRPADGHDDLLERYAATGRWRSTGYVHDDGLATVLAAAAVPVAPNRRVTASASINTWVQHGRRPLVPDSPYAREIAAQRPDSLRLYDPDAAPDHPTSLATAIAAALADPSLTDLPEDVYRGPELAGVADTYRRHLASCAPARAVVTDRGVLVPDNRWDLAPAGPTAATVSVVIPYFDAQPQLDRVLAALTRQTAPPHEIVVVDDGSPESPDVSAAAPLPVRVLRQDDLGFRAARARNLGAAVATGDVLAFLDGDTVPEPAYLAALTDLPGRCPDVVTVGRRRHRASDGAELPEPAWLRDAYRDSADLLHADRRSYRFVISAVLAVPRSLFHGVGGFDERFVGYGGEDWELAHRLRTGGAVLAHVPSAVAWHDGPDWAGRGDEQERIRVKDAETATLAVLLPDPDARGSGRWSPYPSVVVEAPAMTDVDALATLRSAAHVDCAFWFADVTGPRRDLVLADPAARLGDPADDVVGRAWCRAWLHGPTDLGGLAELAELAERHGRIDTPAVTVRSSRSLARAGRWTTHDADATADLLFGRQDRPGPAPATVRDLAGWLRGRR